MSDPTMTVEAVAAAERRHERVVTVRRWVLVTGLVLGVCAVAYDVWATYENTQKTQAVLTAQGELATFTAHAHARTTQLQHQILTLERERSEVANEILALQEQTALLTQQIHAEVPLITAGLNAGQNTLIAQYNEIIGKLNTLCVQSGACGITPTSALQPNPLPTSLPNVGTTTTTTPAPSRPIGPSTPIPPSATTTTTRPNGTTTTTKPGNGPKPPKPPKK